MERNELMRGRPPPLKSIYSQTESCLLTYCSYYIKLLPMLPLVMFLIRYCALQSGTLGSRVLPFHAKPTLLFGISDFQFVLSLLVFHV